MAEKIHIRGADGELESLTERPFQTEDLLQKLIGQHPELLAGDQMRPNDPLRWILVRREAPIEGWAVDHLLLDQEARPTLVEVKRGSNREIRRNIVGQMLDYAATAASVWSGDGVRRAFEEDAAKRGIEPLDELSNLLAHDEEQDDEEWASEFWERVATNLAANRLRLLFVADEIPTELERVVKFLNDQTRDNLEVLAVEVKQYPGGFGQALVSRVIGQAGNGAGNAEPGDRGRLSYEEFLEAFGPDARAAIESMFDAVVGITGDRNDTIRRRRLSVSIRGRCSLWPRPVYLGRLNIPGTGNDSGNFAFFANMAPNYPEPLLRLLEQWSLQFEDDDFGVRHRYRGEIGRAGDMNDFVAHIALLNRRLSATLSELAAL